MSTVNEGSVKPQSLKSEDVIPNALDKCLADTLIKTGCGLALGGVLSLLVFRRRMWPVVFSLGTGLGLGIGNCQYNLRTALPLPKPK